MIVSLIVAMDLLGGIGKDNRLPWHLHSDLKRFKSLTMGHHMVMGRKTYETIGKPLPGRTMVIITRRKAYHPKGCIVVNSIEEATRFAETNHEDEVFIIGGGEIFKQAIGLGKKIYLTTVHTETGADVFFPRIDWVDWSLVWSEDIPQDEKDEFASDFKIFERCH